LKNGAEQKPRFLRCELKKSGMALASHKSRLETLKLAKTKTP
jgi:hypothetical protein